MFHVDRMILPRMPYTSSSPPYIPSVRVDPDYKSIVPAMATALASRATEVAETSKVTIGTYNEMSERSWNNEFFTTVVEMGMWLLTKSMRSRQYQNTNIAVPNCAKEAFSLATGMFYEKYPHLDSFLQAAERQHLKHYLKRYQQLRVEMESVLSRYEGIGVTEAKVSPVSQHPQPQPQPQPKESTMVPTFYIAFDGTQNIVYVRSQYGEFRFSVNEFPEAHRYPPNVQYPVTEQQIGWLQRYFPQVLVGDMARPPAPAHVHHAHVQHPQHAHHHHHHSGAVATATLASAYPSNAISQNDESRYSGISLQNNSGYSAPQSQPRQDQVSTPVEKTVVHKFPESTPLTLRNGAAEEVTLLRHGKLGGIMYPTMPEEVAEDITNLTTGATEVSLYQCASLQDVADYLRNSKEAAENRMAVRSVRLVEGFHIEAELKDTPTGENGEAGEPKFSYPLSSMLYSTLDNQSNPANHLNLLLRNREMSGGQTPEIRAGLYWFDSVMTRRLSSILRNVFQVHVAFDSYSEDLDGLVEHLAENGKSGKQLLAMLEDAAVEIVAANSRATDSEVAEYASYNNIGEDRDLFVVSERTNMVYLPLLSQQINWKIGYKPHHVSDLSNFPLVKLLVQSFEWLNHQFGIAPVMHYMTTRDGVIFRFTKATGNLGWIISRVN